MTTLTQILKQDKYLVSILRKHKKEILGLFTDALTYEPPFEILINRQNKDINSHEGLYELHEVLQKT